MYTSYQPGIADENDVRCIVVNGEGSQVDLLVSLFRRQWLRLAPVHSGCKFPGEASMGHPMILEDGDRGGHTGSASRSLPLNRLPSRKTVQQRLIMRATCHGVASRSMPSALGRG
jgi:hypothetical protein